MAWGQLDPMSCCFPSSPGRAALPACGASHSFSWILQLCYRLFFTQPQECKSLHYCPYKLNKNTFHLDGEKFLEGLHKTGQCLISADAPLM